MAEERQSESPRPDDHGDGGGSARKITRKEVVLTGVGAAALFAPSALAQPKRVRTAAAIRASKTVVIGSSIPVTGFASGDGQDMLRGFKMAVDLVNDRGGIAGRQLKHEYYDAGPFAPDVMVNNFKRLITQKKVDAIIGGYQTNTGPELDVVADAGMLYYHNNTVELNAEKVRSNPKRYWMIFQHDPTEIWYSRSLPGVLDSLEARGTWKPANHNVAIVNANNSYSAGLTKEFQRVIKGTKWKVTLIEQVTAPNTEWGPTLAKIRAKPPAVIWVTDYFAGDDASFIKQFVQKPTNSLVHMQYGPSVPEFLQLTKSAGNGVLWASVIALTQDAIGRPFIDEYRRRFKAEPGFSQGGGTFDSTLIYATAAALAGGPEDRQKIARITRGLIFRGVTGARHFNAQDQTNRPYPTFTKDAGLGMPTQYFQIQNLKHKVIFPSPYTNGRFKLPPWFK
jgi:branched-chain amino acid transport system substrate-binding protein